MPPERIEIGSGVQLLVEGKDAENFFRVPRRDAVHAVQAATHPTVAG